MAKLITDGTRKSIKNMVYVSQCARTLSLMPSAENFAMRLIGDMIIVNRKLNNISIRINEILDKYNLSDNIIKAKDLADVVLEFLKSLDDDVTVKFEIEKQYTYIYLKKRNDKERDMLIYKSKFEGVDLYM